MEREYVPAGEGTDPERASREATRRARRTVRRYCAHHRLDKLWTLTYAEAPTDWPTVWADIERFRRRLARHFGRRLPMVAVIEAGSKNGRLHVHLALGEYLPKRDVQRLWGLGWVDARQIKAVDGKRLQSGSKTACRIAASYLAKYVTKGPEDGQRDGRAMSGKRYSTTRGMTPVPEVAVLVLKGDAFRHASDLMGGTWDMAWSSEEDEHWRGPPVWLGFWS